MFDKQCEIALKNIETLIGQYGDLVQVARVTGTDFGTQRGLFISIGAYRDGRLIENFRHGFPFWLCGGFCVALVAFMIWVVPETKGKTLEEIERRWR